MPGPCSILNPTSVDFRRYNSMPDSAAASPLSSPPASRSHSVTDLHHSHSASSHPHPHPHPRSHPLDHAPRTGSPLARRTESPGTRVQFADDPDRSRSPSIERTSHPGRINDMPTGSLSAAIAARAASPSLTSPPPQPQQQGLPPQRRLSSRRGSMAAVDPWGKHYNEENQPHSSTSRLTIVRVPNTNTVVEEDPHGHSPSPGPYGGSSSFRERSHQRRSSWGANSGSDGEGEGGRKRSRMSFAFSSFTPISPTPVSARQGPPQRTGSPGVGSGFATSFGPAQSRTRTRSIGSTGGVDLSSHNPTQDRSGARHVQLSAQQLYDLAMASRDPAAPRSTPVQGVSAAVEPAHFTALPEGEILPFLDRPGEVEALINTPGTQSYKLFALLGILFPRPKEDEPAKEEAKEEAPMATPKAQPSQPMWPPFPGEVRDEKSAEVVQPPSPATVPPSKAAPAQHPLGLPSHPTQWTYAQLITHLTQTTREQLPDKEWVLFARACIRNRSEALWERVKGCLGVPNDIYEDEDLEDDEEESPIGPVGITDLANLSPVARFKALRDREVESAAAGSDRAPSDDGHEPEAWIEPVFPGGPGSARGSVSNSPTNYFTGATGLGGGRGDSKSWAGSVSGRSDGGRMELIGEEEEEEEGENNDKNSTGAPADKTPEPDSPVVGLRIMTTPMSPGFHPAHAAASNSGLSGTASPPPGTGDNTPSGGVPVPVTGSGAASPTPASPSPSIHQFLGPPMPKARGGAWISPLSNTISTGARGLSGMGGRSGAGWNSPTGSGSGYNSPVHGGGGGGWNSPLSRGNRGSRGAWDPATERGPGNPIFPSSFARLSLGPTLIANNPNHRNPAPTAAYPPFRYLRERYKWARPGSENDFAITIASESSDAGGRS